MSITMVKRTLVTATAAVAFAAGAGVVAANPASAAGSTPRAAGAAADEPVQTLLTKSCYTAPTSCTTASVRPYPEGYIAYLVTTGAVGCSYRVRDVTLNRVLRSGRIYFSFGGNISGLTRAHTYRLELHSCTPASYGVINGSPV